MLRSILAVLGGFAAMAVTVMATTAIAATALVPGGIRVMTAPGQPLPKAYLTVNLLCSALAALMVVMGLASARQAGGQQPRWYQRTLTWAMPALALLGAWAGGAVARAS